MNKKHIAELYYIAMNDKDIDRASAYFHPAITLKTPMMSLTGKAEVTAAAGQFIEMFQNLEVRDIIENGNKAVVIYDLNSAIGNISTASFIKCKDELIESIELFYDTKPFLK